MILEHDRARPGVLGRSLRELEARAQVRHERHVVTQGLGHATPALGMIRERADRVRVRVVDVPRREKGVQEGFDRRPPRAGIGHAVRQIGDHCVVAHRLGLSQRQELVEEEAREPVAADRAKIGAAPLTRITSCSRPRSRSRSLVDVLPPPCTTSAGPRRYVGTLDEAVELARLVTHRACTGASPALSRVISSATIATPRSMVSAVAPPMCGVTTTRGSSSSGLRLATGAGRTTSSAAPPR